MSAATLRDANTLRQLAARAAVRLSRAHAEDIVAWAAHEFGTRWAVASSMQDAVLAHLVAVVAPGTDVLFLQTGYHFPETLATREQVAREYPLRVRDLRAELSVAEQDAAYGKDLFRTDPDLCCLLRKSTPLAEALHGYEAWGTGLRRAEAATRAGATEVCFDDTHGIVKVNPLVAWSDADVQRYAVEHDVIRNPLLARGYPSIGCWPCTRPVTPGQDPRSGRWAGVPKTECGIHR